MAVNNIPIPPISLEFSTFYSNTLIDVNQFNYNLNILNTQFQYINSSIQTIPLLTQKSLISASQLNNTFLTIQQAIQICLGNSGIIVDENNNQMDLSISENIQQNTLITPELINEKFKIIDYDMCVVSNENKKRAGYDGYYAIGFETDYFSKQYFLAMFQQAQNNIITINRGFLFKTLDGSSTLRWQNQPQLLQNCNTGYIYSLNDSVEGQVLFNSSPSSSYVSTLNFKDGKFYDELDREYGYINTYLYCDSTSIYYVHVYPPSLTYIYNSNEYGVYLSCQLERSGTNVYYNSSTMQAPYIEIRSCPLAYIL